MCCTCILKLRDKLLLSKLKFEKGLFLKMYHKYHQFRIYYFEVLMYLRPKI